MMIMTVNLNLQIFIMTIEISYASSSYSSIYLNTLLIKDIVKIYRARTTVKFSFWF